jgi:hypothetical protein
MVAIVGGCDRVPLTAPTESTITLAASNLVLPVNGSTEIIASVTEKPGTPVHNGTVVTFTTTVGTIEPREARTQGGKVTVRLFAGGQSGTAKVGAFSGSAKATEIEIRVGGAAAETLNLIISPATLPSVGGTAEVVATVNDASGNRLAGVPVTFTTSAGTVSPSTVVTDGNGEARATLLTTRQAEVTATAGTKSQRVTVTLNAAPTVSIQTSANPTEDTPTTFTINVGASAAGSSVRNVTIDYGDGQIDQLGAQTGTITATHIYGSPGTYTVRVNVTDSSGETTPATTVINVAPATPVSVNVTAQPPTPRVRENVIFTANVSPATAQIREYRWDFGDGFNRTTTGNQTNHFYDRVGQRTVTVLAVNVDGRTHRGETEIIVQP